MKETSEQWLRAAEDDLRVVARIASDEHLTHMVAYPGELGLLPNGKPTREDAQRFHRFAQSLHDQIKRVLEAAD